MTVVEESFGKTPGGEEVKLFRLENSKGAKVEVTNFGATWRSWEVIDKHGKPVDIVLGYDDIKGYVNGEGYLGCTVGRVCNRIRDGKFRLDGKEYSLAVNNPPNHLHGGLIGFSHKVWDAKCEQSENSVHFTYESPDGEEGYPGHVICHVTYQLTNENEVKIHFQATTNKPTPLNLTNHAYFNLAGEGDISIADHEICINADHFLPIDENHLVTGEIKSVEGCPQDLRSLVSLGGQMKKLDKPGLDSHFCIKDADGSLKQAAIVECKRSGLRLEVFTTQPGVQLYTATFLDQIGKGGKHYGKLCSLCLETQGCPNAINEPAFPSVVLDPKEKYNHTTIFKCTLL